MPSRRTALAAVVVAASLAASPREARAAAPDGELTSAGAIRGLSAAEAAGNLPVRLRAVVTFVYEDNRFLFVQDATDGIFIDAWGTPPPPTRPGDLVIVEGTTAPGLFAPQIRLKSLSVIGTAPLPPARPSTYAELASGKHDSQLVSVEGTVRAVGVEPARPDKQYRLVFNLAAGGGTFQLRVRLADPSAMRLDGLIDATVTLRGVCGGIFNPQRQLIGVVLHAWDPLESTCRHASLSIL